MKMISVLLLEGMPQNINSAVSFKSVQSRFAQFFLIGMVYFRWYLINPHVQTVEIAKGGRGSLRPSYGRPKLTLVSTFVAS